MSKYRFNKERHLHQIEVDGDWKNLTGCTTILGILSKPALIPWAAKMAVEYIRENCEEEDGFYLVSEQRLDEAKVAHAKRKTDAGNWGTNTHENINLMISKDLAGVEYLLEQQPKDKSSELFLDWVKKNNVKMLMTEKNIYSESLFIGGIVDFVCEIDGQKWIGDIKTSGSGIYAEHFFQCAGYQLMLEDMNLFTDSDITGYIILNIKENGEFLEKRDVSKKENKKIFLNCLEIYRQQEKLKSNINI